MVKRILSVLVTLSFLANSVCVADVLSVKDRPGTSSSTLAPESRLNPVTNPEMLDIIKLTTEITDVASRKDVMSYSEREYRGIDAIGLETTALKEAARKGDEIILNFEEI